MHSPLLAPVLTLIAWTLVMQVWLYRARFGAFKAMGVALKGRRGSRPGQLDGVLPDQAQWVAHNYDHLLQQPTIFYATTFALVLMSVAGPVALLLAWAYVLLRIAHSVVQATTNLLSLRFGLFSASSAALAGLAVLAIAAFIRG